MAVLVTLASLVATLLGGLVALRSRDKLHLILGLAAGVLLGVVGFDLLPEMFAQNRYHVLGVPAVMVTFAAGFLALHIVERGTALHRGHEHEYEPHGHHYPTVGVLAATALVVHSFMDGLGIGLGFQAGAAVGVAVTLAVVAHDFADGFNTFTITTLYGNARRRALTLLVLDALAPVVGAAVTLVARIPDSALGLYLGFFAGFLLYIATSDILPEAHSRHPSRLTLASTVAGMAFMFLVVGVAG